jgi:membrane protease YdiL (CAAX protease family)
MPTGVDFVYVAAIAVAWPIFDYFVLWPAFLRRSQLDPFRARLWIWAVTIGEQWALAAAGATLWLLDERPWGWLGLSVPVEWRLWGSIGLLLLLTLLYARMAVKVMKSARARASARSQAAQSAGLLPHTLPELYGFVAVSLTAGFCEEFLFRGYLIWAFAQWLDWWGAAAVSLPFFAALHAYQGRNGIVRSGIAGALLTLVVAIFGSLYPAIALHALIDIASGFILWQALREKSEKTAIAPDREHVLGAGSDS